MSWIGYELISGGGTDYAKEAQKAEDKRQAAIKKGTADVNKQFAGFNQGFYDKRRQAYLDFALPQLADQYRTTHGQVGFGLSDRGIRGSGAAQKQWSDLFKTTESAKQGIADSATAQANDLKKQIAAQQQNLINQLYITSDPAQAKQAAISTAAGFQTPSTFAPLVNQFSGLLNQYYVSQMLKPTTTTGTYPPVYGGYGGDSYGSGLAPLPAASTSFGTGGEI